MKTLTEKYRGVLNESFSKTQFVRDARMAQPQLINQFLGFDDTVQILKQKGMISEKDGTPEYKEFDNISDEAIRRGIDAELEAMGLMSQESHSEEDHAKAKDKALKNLKKDPLHYLNLMSGESNKVDKHDQMVEPKKGNEVDTFNGMKKAELKEGTPGYHADGTAKSNDEMDDDERNDFYDNLDSVPEQTTKSLREQTIDVISLLKKERQADNDVIKDFIKTHFNDIRGASPSEIVDEFDEFVSVNYESPSDYMQETEKESRPHMSSDKFLRHIEKLHKDNQTQIAKEKEVEEAMSDQQMKDIQKYGQEDKVVKSFKPGDKFSTDFDYEGMLEFGMKIRLNTPIATLQALYDSFEDVNYHSENSHLGMAIDAIKDGDKSEALDHIRMFKKAIKKTLISFNEGVNPNRKGLEEAEVVVAERVGGLQEFISLIEDRAAENDTTEAEEAEEVVYAIGDHYNFGVDIMHAPNEAKGKDHDGEIIAYIADTYIQNAKDGDRRFDGFRDLNIRDAVQDVIGILQDPKHPLHVDTKVEYEIVEKDKARGLFEKKGKDHDGDGDVDGDDYMAAKDKAIKKAMGKDEIVKENIKSIIQKVLEEGTINEAATQELAKLADTYGGFNGMKSVLVQLQDIVTDIESYYDKTRDKIQKAFDAMGDVSNEEGLKVGGFLSPAVESAFTKDLRPVTRKGFTKGLDQPKVRVISQRDIDRHNSGEAPLGEEEKQTVYTPTVNGTLRETKK